MNETEVKANGQDTHVAVRRRQMKTLVCDRCAARKASRSFPRGAQGVHLTTCHPCVDKLTRAGARPEAVPARSPAPTPPTLSMPAGYGLQMLVDPKSGEITLVQEAARIFLTAFEGEALRGALGKLAPIAA